MLCASVYDVVLCKVCYKRLLGVEQGGFFYYYYIEYLVHAGNKPTEVGRKPDTLGKEAHRGGKNAPHTWEGKLTEVGRKPAYIHAGIYKWRGGG